MKKRLRYVKLLIIEENQAKLREEIERQFQIYGKVEEIKFIPQGDKGQYKASVLIVVEQNLAEFEKWTYLDGWEKELEYILRQ